MKCSNPFCLFCVRPPGSSTTWTHQCWPACPAPSCCSAWPTTWCPPSPPECLAPISGESSVMFASPLCRQVFLFCQSVLKASYITLASEMTSSFGLWLNWVVKEDDVYYRNVQQTSTGGWNWMLIRVSGSFQLSLNYERSSFIWLCFCVFDFFFPASQKWWSNREGDLRWCNENSCVSEHNTCHGLTGR